MAGPIATTQSRFDTAVGRWYPLGAGAARQIDMAPGDLSRYGGVGTFGLRGPGLDLVDLDLLAVDQPYPFQSGRVYNITWKAVGSFATAEERPGRTVTSSTRKSRTRFGPLL